MFEVNISIINIYLSYYVYSAELMVITSRYIRSWLASLMMSLRYCASKTLDLVANGL